MGGLDPAQIKRRQAAVDSIAAIKATKQRHCDISHIERKAYNKERDGQDEKYKQAAMDFKVLMDHLDELTSVVEIKNAIKAFVAAHPTIKLYIDMDYQADKILQKFKDQPV